MRNMRGTDASSARPVLSLRKLDAPGIDKLKWALAACRLDDRSRNRQIVKAEPAVYVWFALVASALTADVILVRKGHRSLSQVADCKLGRAARRYLNGHLEGQLYLDAFHIAASLLRPKGPVVVLDAPATGTITVAPFPRSIP